MSQARLVAAGAGPVALLPGKAAGAAGSKSQQQRIFRATGGGATALLQQQQRRSSPGFLISGRSARIASRRSAAYGEGPQRVDGEYPANAADKPVLQQDPGTAISVQEAANCFDYPRNLNERYYITDALGAGGFGQVYRAVSVETGAEYACKSIPKVAPGARHVTPPHLLRIRSEVDAMMQLGASLDAVALKEVFEDDIYVHLIIELCSGGAVLDDGEYPSYSEQEVADIMRSVMRFLALCDAKGVMHRDVKPANFLFSDKSPSRHVKATDFGVAVLHGANDPPLTTVVGTTLFLAPEVLLQQQYTSRADVYSAGIMAFMLLMGRYPYGPTPPAPEMMYAAITREIDFSGLSAEGISDMAQDFLQRLLTKDPSQRPSAAEALDHPWLQPQAAAPGALGEGSMDGGVVQALQRFGVSGPFRQVTLCLMAEELVAAGMGELLRSSSASSDLLDFYLSTSGSDPSLRIPRTDVMDKMSSSQSFDLSPAELGQLTSFMDVSKDGLIDRYELVSSLIDWEAVAKAAPQPWEEALGRVFARFDRNRDGCICMTDIQEHLLAHHAPSTTGAQQQAGDMLRDVDFDSDGRIGWAEFHEALSPGGRVGIMPALHHFDSRQQ